MPDLNTITLPPTDVATAHELTIHERLESALFDIRHALTTAKALADRHPDADLSFDLGCDLVGFELDLDLAVRRLAQYAAAHAELPAQIEELPHAPLVHGSYPVDPIDEAEWQHILNKHGEV